jgi:hypothetical protein
VHSNSPCFENELNCEVAEKSLPSHAAPVEPISTRVNTPVPPRCWSELRRLRIERDNRRAKTLFTTLSETASSTVVFTEPEAPGLGPRPGQISFATILMASASSVTLKMKETKLCSITVFRITFDFTWTSDTCQVMPITKEKYMKSR